ncbi:sulfite oxidase-like oxidoreductase [Spirillospora sp. NPDC050679]
MNEFSPGFRRRSRQQDSDGRLPPGQYLTEDFPVLSAGPTPRIIQAAWQFTAETERGERRAWTWPQFMELPQDTPRVDIHCVTRWSKYDTTWQGVSLDTLLEGMETGATHAVFHCYGGYTTNVPLPEITGGKAWVVHTYDGRPLAPEHGGPARVLIPHLYFWKSAKWVQGLRLLTHDQPGFWETAGYHNHGDPWREERYSWN